MKIGRKRAAAITLLAMLPVLLSCVAADQPIAEEAAPAVQDSVRRIAAGYAARSDLVGFTVAVARHGRLLTAAGFGQRQPGSPAPIDADAVLDYFSVGKIVTAALLLGLAEQGRLDLDAPVSALLPSADFHGAPVTARQLLSHSSGLWEPERDETIASPELTTAPPPGAVVAVANGSRRLAAPGATWLYSNHGFLFAGALAEAATGRPFEALVADELARPLGLDSFGSCTFLDSRRAPGFTIRNDAPRPIPAIDTRWFGGAGSICGSAADLVRWWSLLQAGRVLGAASLEQMQTPVVLASNGATASFGYGLGLRLGRLHGQRKIGHTGNGAGGTSVLAAYPDSGWVIAVITNTAGGGVPHALEIEAELAAALMDLAPDIDRQPLPAALAAAAPGYYESPEGVFCVTRGERGLLARQAPAAPTPLVHLRDGRFSRDPGIQEYFLGMHDGRAHWFAYDWHGFPMDLATRSADRCPPPDPAAASPAASRHGQRLAALGTPAGGTIRPHSR